MPKPLNPNPDFYMNEIKVDLTIKNLRLRDKLPLAWMTAMDIHQHLANKIIGGYFALPRVPDQPIGEIYDTIEAPANSRLTGAAKGWKQFAEANQLITSIRLHGDGCVIIVTIKKDDDWLMNSALIHIDKKGKVTKIDYDTGP
jgi:hypothetical protein